MALTDSLVAYWSLESDGTDATGRGNTLTNSGATFTTGKVNNGVDLESGDSDYLYIADNPDVSSGNVNFTATAWVKFETVISSAVILNKFNDTADREYLLRVSGTSLQWLWSTNAVGGRVDLTATTFGAVSTGTWYFVEAGHNASTNQTWISVNAGTRDTASASGGNDGAAAFEIGRQGNASNYHDGLVDEVGIWKRVLSEAEIDELYNSGTGLAYPFSSGNPLALFAAQMRAMYAHGGVSVG